MKTVELELHIVTGKQKLEEKIEELENFLKNQKSKDKKEFSKDEKIELFRELFISRTDIFAKKWKSKDGTKEGFSPVSKKFIFGISSLPHNQNLKVMGQNATTQTQPIAMITHNNHLHA